MTITAYDLAREIINALDEEPSAIAVYSDDDVHLTDEAIRVVEDMIRAALLKQGLIP